MRKMIEAILRHLKNHFQNRLDFPQTFRNTKSEVHVQSQNSVLSKSNWIFKDTILSNYK